MPSLIGHKPDWESAKTRWRAFWDRQPTDRPCLAVKASRAHDPPNWETKWHEGDNA